MGAGILWGAAALWLAPHDQFAQFFFLFVVTGIISGSVSAMSPYLPSLYVFLAPVLLSISYSMLLQRGALGNFRGDDDPALPGR